MGKTNQDINASTVEEVVENNVASKETTDKAPETVAIESGTLKDKLIARTEQMGVTQGGKLVKGLFWGMAFGALLVLGFQHAKDKGYIKLK